MNKYICDCKSCNKISNHSLLFVGIDPDTTQQSEIPVIQCNSCKLVVSVPHNTNVNMYNSNYYGTTQRRHVYFSIIEQIFYAERRWRSIGGYKTTSLLDYGCGTGDFLKTLPKNVSRYGFEISKAAIKSIKNEKQNKINLVYKNTLIANHYDVVTMWQSLEHIADPVPVLKLLSSVLNHNGYLYISVPNIKSIQARIFKGKWFHLDPNRHLTHYSAESLKKILALSNLEMVKMTTFSFEYGVFGWWQSIFNAIPFEFNMGYKIIKRGITYPKTARNLFGYLCYGLLSLPIALISVFFMLLEALMGAGCVLQCKVRPTYSK